MSKQTQKQVKSATQVRETRVHHQGNLEAWFPWIAACLAVVAYINTLGHGFVLDDPLILEQNKYVTRGFSGIGDLLFKSYRADVADGAATGFLYRPLSPVFFAMEWSIGGGKPFIFHLFQVLWYAVSCSIMYITLRKLLPNAHWMIAAAATLLFIVHPLHTEVVANIKSRDEVLALFFGLGALYAWLRWRDAESDIKWLLFSLTSFFLALLAKESAITLLPAFPLADWVLRRATIAQSFKTLAITAIPVLLFLGLRATVYAGWSGAQQFEEMDNPIIGASGYAERSATGFMVLLKYLQLLCLPQPLLCDYSYNQLPLVQWQSIKAIGGFLVFGGLATWSIWAFFKRNTLSYFVLCFLASVVLYSQLFVVIGTLFGERLMYLPSFWFCSGLALFASKWLPEKWVFGTAAAVSCLFLFLTINRNSGWKNNLSLFTTDAAKATQSVRLQNGVGSESYTTWVKAGKKPEALPQLVQTLNTYSNAALAIKPNPVSYINLSLAALEQKQYAEAESNLLKAKALAPNLSIVQRNLIAVYYNWARVEGREKNNLPEAIRLFENLLALGHQPPEVLQDLGTAYAMSGNHLKAIENFEKALAVGATDPGVRRNLAMSYQAIGNLEKAAQYAQPK